MNETAVRRVLGRRRGDRAFVGDPWREAGGEVRPKRGVIDVLRRELARKVGPADRIRVGDAAEPYPAAEARDGITRQFLRTLAEAERGPVHLTTASDLVLRDLDLLLRLEDTGGVSVDVVFATTDPVLSRRIAPGATSPARRLRALRKLTVSGIPAGLRLDPVLPGITDSLGDLTAAADAAAGAGAEWFDVRPLRLTPGSRRRFFAFLDRCRPDLVRRYRWRYRGREHPPREYTDRLASIADILRFERGLAPGPASRESPRTGQLVLPFLGGGIR